MALNCQPWLYYEDLQVECRHWYHINNLSALCSNSVSSTLSTILYPKIEISLWVLFKAVGCHSEFMEGYRLKSANSTSIIGYAMPNNLLNLIQLFTIEEATTQTQVPESVCVCCSQLILIARLINKLPLAYCWISSIGSKSSLR